VSYDVEVDGRIMKRHVDHLLSQENMSPGNLNTSPVSETVIPVPESPVAAIPVQSPARSPIPIHHQSPELVVIDDEDPPDGPRYPRRQRNQRIIHNVSTFE